MNPRCLALIALAATACTSESHIATSGGDGKLDTTVIDGQRWGRISETAVVGDLDGDGLDDFVLGDGDVDHAEVQEGSVYLFYGRSGRFPRRISATDADAILIGSLRYGHAGSVLARAGDVDGDGLADLLIGAPRPDPDAPRPREAYLLYGSSTRLSGRHYLEHVASVIAGADSETEVGFDLAGAGDVDGDGYDDLLVSAPRRHSSGLRDGEVWLLRGSSDRPSELAVEDAVTRFRGTSGDLVIHLGAASAGDLDGDGFQDVVIQLRNEDPTQPGGVALYYGGPGMLAGDLGPADADALLVGMRASWQTIGGVGDLDGDGLPELAVPEGDRARALHVFLGGRTRLAGSLSSSDAALSIEPEDVASYLGAGLAGGDVNGDGLADLVIGDPHNPIGGGLQAGALYVIYGSAPRSTGTHRLSEDDVVLRGRIEGSGHDAYSADLGYGVSSGGDVNGDGYEDVLVAAPTASIGDENGGRVYLLYGEPRPVDADPGVWPSEPMGD